MPVWCLRVYHCRFTVISDPTGSSTWPVNSAGQQCSVFTLELSSPAQLAHTRRNIFHVKMRLKTKQGNLSPILSEEVKN